MKGKTNKDFWLYNYPIAHRGYFCHEENIPENTIVAFEAAIKNGYPIETDVQMSTDGELFCFHDHNTLKMCGIDRDIRDMSSEEIRKLRPLNLEYGVMTFKEFLDFVDGRVPLLIEIKDQKRKGIEKKVVDTLRGYKGEFVIQAFCPWIIKRIHKLNKEIIVGILTTTYPPFKSKVTNFILSHYLFKPFVKFDFLNIRIEDLEKHEKYSKGYPVIAWTARDNDVIPFCEKYSLSIVFERSCTNLGKFNKSLTH